MDTGPAEMFPARLWPQPAGKRSNRGAPAGQCPAHKPPRQLGSEPLGSCLAVVDARDSLAQISALRPGGPDLTPPVGETSISVLSASPEDARALIAQACAWLEAAQSVAVLTGAGISAESGRMIAYFDCFSGISGDMVLGALVDAGCDLARIETELRRLPVTGWKIQAEKVARGGLTATQVRVETTEHHHHRSLDAILELIGTAGLEPRVAERACRIFRRLGDAEARVHNLPVEKVHFHEVGAVDAIVDIVGACIGFELLALDEFACSALNVGGGHVQTQHGTLPVPAPATAELLRGAPTYSTGIGRELVTPTGAAIATTLASRFGPLPLMTASAIGYGAGSAQLAEQPNVLRLLIEIGRAHV